MKKNSVTAPTNSWQTLFFYYLVLCGAIAGIMLAGSAEEGGEGIFLATAGVGMLCFSPRVRVEGKIWGLAGLFIICCGLSLLPVPTWLNPAWRTHFAGVAVDLGPLFTPVPRETLFWLGTACVSVVFLLFCLAQPLRSRGLLGLAVSGALVCATYAGLSIYSLKTGWQWPFDTELTFGFFPNRNHAASFLVTGCILSLGVLGVTGAQKQWVAGALAAVALATCSVSLMVYSASRGGIVFLVVGTVIWLSGLGRSRWTGPLLWSFVAIFCASSALFLVSKGEARNRILAEIGLGERKNTLSNTERPEADSERDISLDGRIQIYRDVWRMIKDAPITGVGIGAYTYIYPQYRHFSLAEATSIHPESDWLMLAAEAGLPALAVAGVAMLVLIRRVFSQRDHVYWPLRWGVICATIAVLAHGLVDVPVHRLALGWWVAVFAGIGLQIRPDDERKVPVIQRIIFLATGLLALLMGAWMIRSQWFGGAPTPPFAAAHAEKEIYRLQKADQLELASDLASKSISDSPMAHGLYFQKGALQYCFEGTNSEVDSLFKAQRTLNPDWWQIPMYQAKVWMESDEKRALDLYRDALQRSSRLDDAQRSGNKKWLSTYEQILQRSGSHTNLLIALLQDAGQSPAATMVWMRMAPPELVVQKLPTVLQNRAFLNIFASEEKVQFLRAWYEKGDRAALVEFADAHPDWQEAYWPVKIRQMVDGKNYEGAVTETIAHYQLDLNLPASGNSKKLSIPDDRDAPLANFAYFWGAGNEITARRIIDEARTKAEKTGKRAPEIWKTSVGLEMQAGRWYLAWTYLQRYLRETGREASF